MAASAEIITKPVTNALSVRWIIGARDDLVWFIGSVVSSYALLILYVGGIVPLIPMVAFWAIMIDAPHVFGPFSRTYFDRTERQNRARLLWGSLAFFAIGPVMVLAGFGLVFLFVAALWAYYHLVKQHYGFMVLYKKKNGDPRASITYSIEGCCCLLSTIRSSSLSRAIRKRWRAYRRYCVAA